MQGWNNEIKEKVMARRPERNHEAYNVHTTKAFESPSETSMYVLASLTQIWRIDNFCYCTYNRGVVLVDVLIINAGGVYYFLGSNQGRLIDRRR